MAMSNEVYSLQDSSQGPNTTMRIMYLINEEKVRLFFFCHINSDALFLLSCPAFNSKASQQ